MGQTKRVPTGLHAIQSSERIVSIDALRGFDMFWVAGGGPFLLEFCKLFSNPLPAWLARQFEHAEWVGFPAADVVMPLFLFIVGVAMPFALGKRLERGDRRGSVYSKVIYRVVMLWILGMVAQGNLLALDLNKFHFYNNTLQAIAVGYLISSVALMELPVRGQAALCGALLVIYWALLRFIPVPGHVAGICTPDVNLAIYIDKALQGRLQDGTTYAWILSSLAFGAQVLMGVLAGQLLRSKLAGARKALLLAGSGLGCLLVGWLWSFTFPIIKHIYSSSMVLWAGGWCLLLLALFYWVIDVRGYRRWAFFFIVIGMNAIFAYLSPGIIPFWRISDAVLAGLVRHLGRFGACLWEAGPVAVLWICLYYMYRKQTFLRI